MTTEEFKEKCLLKNKFYRDGCFEILGEYIKMKTKILCKNKYSFHLKTPERLLNGENLSSKTTVNTVEYYSNYITDKNPSFVTKKDLLVDIVKEAGVNYCLFNTPYGYCKLVVASLINGSDFSIRNAVDKNTYFINIIKDSNIGITDYSDINYINNHTSVKYKTKYGMCEMLPSHLLLCDRADSINSAIDKTEFFRKQITHIPVK